MGTISWKDVRGRLTGLSLPFGGLSWVPDPDERKIAEEAVTYMENQGIFYAPFEWEHPQETYASADRVRAELTVLMQKPLRRMTVFDRLKIIRNALREFQRQLRRLNLSQIPSKSAMTNEEIAAYDAALVGLRQTSGAEIACLSAIYELDVFDELDLWLRPPARAEQA